MTLVATFSRPLGALVLGLALLGTGGCATRSTGDGCGCVAPVDCVRGACGTLPTDMPKDPDPCAKYCRVWVPPQYRMVPRLEKVRDACMVCDEKTVMETSFVEREVKPARGYWVSSEPGLCQQTAVEVAPGGWRWQEVGCGCWKYCYTPPAYNWCTKTVKEEGITYCNEEPAEYETVAVTCPKKTTTSKYVPPEYRAVYERECIRPGRWEWVAKDDPCGTCFPNYGEARTYPVGGCEPVGGCRPAGLSKGCARCN